MEFDLSGIEFYYEILDLKDNSYNIEFHDRLMKYGKYDITHVFCIVNPPIFIKRENKYLLVARHCVYSYYVTNGLFRFPALIINDEELLEQILEMDKVESQIYLNNINSVLKGSNQKRQSRKTITRKKAIESGRVCPFCDGPLRASLDKESRKKGQYKVTCENKSNKNINEGKGCDFYGILTEQEFKKFNKYELPTNEWLVKLDNKECPICHKEVFLRKRINQDTNEIVYQERCRNYKNSTMHNCKYNKKYTEKNDAPTI